MRLIIQPDYEKISSWAASYIVSKINAFAPTENKPFVLGLPTGSSPVGVSVRGHFSGNLEAHRPSQP